MNQQTRPICPHCDCNKPMRKHGTGHNDNPRYRCGVCGKTYTPSPKETDNPPCPECGTTLHKHGFDVTKAGGQYYLCPGCGLGTDLKTTTKKSHNVKKTAVSDAAKVLEELPEK